MPSIYFLEKEYYNGRRISRELHRGESVKKSQLYLKIFVNLIIFVLGILFAFLVVPKLLSFFAPFVIGWLIAMIANPLVRFMEKKVKIVRKHSSAIIIVLVILAIVGALYGIAYYVITQISSLMNDLPDMLSSVQRLFDNASERFQRIYEVLPLSMQGVIDSVIENVQGKLQEYISNPGTLGISSTAGTVAKNVVEFALNAMITILSAYFFIQERDNLAAVVKKSLPESVVKNYYIVVDNFKMAFGGYFKAQFKIMGILTVILFIGLEIMQVDYSFLFALLIAVLDFLPFFGTGAILWPWAVIELFAGNIPRAICIMVIYLVCQIVRQVLQPKMVGDSIGISPFATLIFMYIGYRLYGAIGMILGIPIGMVVIKFYHLGMFDNMLKGFKMLIRDINEYRKF